ncbi:SIR2 family protein [Marinobacter nauticus]|uniref:SIR2 family protein n=1 Tax=Marinobacter nauticus TaxID=2743 RepID=UPI0040450F35
MATALDSLPDVPEELENAAQSGELVVFVGAGVSRLVDCPSWDGFANKVLSQLVPKHLDYYSLAQIRGISDPKKRLSIAKIVAERNDVDIDYSQIFDVESKADDIYSHLNLFNSCFVTTNYDKLLSPKSKNEELEAGWRFFERKDLLKANLDVSGNVIHLHGCVDNADSMVVTTKDYLDHYSSTEVKDFLSYLFSSKIVLFLGYGLEEIEVLEYILRKSDIGSEHGKSTQARRYILQGFFQADMPLYELLRDYYRDSFGTELIGFPKDFRSYDQLTLILKHWSRSLRFAGLSLTDEAAAMEDEIGD